MSCKTEKKQLRLILQNNLANSLTFVYQEVTELLYNVKHNTGSLVMGKIQGATGFIFL